ncbi:urease accessory protein UreD [Algirhabdus cladophorae]|uniref:urease accessory protein UreD n=1 Tax=Algirhabdus cladophorae TaxID=3377108 RepID=UPI003B847B09
MTVPIQLDPSAARPVPQQPRAQGSLSVSSKARAEMSVLDDMHQRGSYKLLFPRRNGSALEAVVINTAGGVTGGDRYQLTAHAGANTQLILTTQAAERAYRAQAGEVGQVTNTLSAGSHAALHWMPQETILFDNCALDRTLSVDLDTTATALICETLVFGRMAMGEVLNSAVLRDRITVRRAGVPVFLDALHLSGDVASHLADPAVAAGAGALATVVYTAPDAQTHLQPIRDSLGPQAGVSLLGPDLLVIRALAHDSFVLRGTLVPLLKRLSGAPVPRPWMI